MLHSRNHYLCFCFVCSRRSSRKGGGVHAHPDCCSPSAKSRPPSSARKICAVVPCPENLVHCLQDQYQCPFFPDIPCVFISRPPDRTQRAVATVLADHDLSAMAVHVPNVHQRRAKVSTILITDPATSAFGLDHISPAHGRRCSAHCQPSLFFDNTEKNVGSASSFVVTSIPSRSKFIPDRPTSFLVS